MDQQTQLVLNIAPYLNVQQAYYPAHTGAGEHIAFLSTMTGVPQVWTVAGRRTSQRFHGLRNGPSRPTA